MLQELRVQFEIMGGVSIDNCSSGPLVGNGVFFPSKVVDQNGSAGHCVVIELFRKVILDPAEEWEVNLEKSYLLQCAGPMSLCMEFKYVLQIQRIDGVKVGQLNYDLRNKEKKKITQGA